MRYLIILVLFFFSCEPIYYQPEMIEGECYIFSPPESFDYDIIDTVVIMKIEADFILTMDNKGNYVKYEKHNFAYYLRPIDNCNCNL